MEVQRPGGGGLRRISWEGGHIGATAKACSGSTVDSVEIASGNQGGSGH